MTEASLVQQTLLDKLRSADIQTLSTELLKLYDEVLQDYISRGAELWYARSVAAVAYCLIREAGSELLAQWPSLRLAALIHNLPESMRQVVLDRVQSDSERQLVVTLLQDYPTAQDAFLGSAASILHFAQLAVARSDDPLLPQVHARIGLVYGGATKIKQYVFESARIPEIRGASGLLDRINLLDLPALWGQEPSEDEWSKDYYFKEAQQRYDAVRTQFKKRTKHEPPLAPECIIYAHGGNILAFAPVSLMNELADEIELIYTQETLVANSVAVAQSFSLAELARGYATEKISPSDWQPAAVKDALSALTGMDETIAESSKCFGEWVARLEAATQRRRAGNADGARPPKPAPHFELLPHARRCSSCDRRAAVSEIVIGTDRKLYCEPCARKRLFGAMGKYRDEEQRQEILRQKKFDWDALAARAWVDVFDAYLLSRDKREEYSQEPLCTPRDLSDIGALSKPDDYIGLIQADVNGLGRLIHSSRTPQEYHQKANRAYHVLQEAVFAAIAKHLKPSGKRYPFEILSIGGDDVLLIVPGHQGLHVAYEIARLFEEQLRDWDAGRLKTQGPQPNPHRYDQRPADERDWREEADSPVVSLSAGVVIAHANTPFLFLRDLCEELLGNAKKKARALQEADFPYHGGAVDFAVLKSTPMFSSNVEAYRHAALAVKDRSMKKDNRLTMRPFTLKELEGLLEGVSELKRAGVPRSQLHLLRQDVVQSRAKSVLNFLYFERRHPQEGETVRKHVLEPWGLTETPPWREARDKAYETPWLDLMEIYDFVEAG